MIQTCFNIIVEPDEVVKLKFSKHKIMTLKLPSWYHNVAVNFNDERFLRWADNVSECGNFLIFGKYQKAGLKLHRANFCKDRLCPNCNWRRSLRTFSKLTKIIKSKEFIETKYRSLFLTLTVKNCEVTELHKTIDNLLYSFEKFLKIKEIKNINKGYFRALEIKFNKETGFHPHLHVIVCVNSSYFTDPTSYLSQAKFTEFWKQALNVNDYNPVIDIRKVKDSGGIAEVSKYAVKVDNELFDNIDIETLFHLRLELYKRRLTGMGGIIRKLAAKLNVGLESDDFVNDLNVDVDDILLALITMRWSVGLKTYEVIETEKVGF